jgi:hypothetical protein
MRRSTLALLLLLTAVAAGTPSVPPGGPSAVQVLEAQPDTTKAKPLERWPNAQDIAKLKSVEGEPKWKVIQVLGHPSAVDRRPDGTEVWDYPWCAACRVWVSNGVCTGTFYTGGY